MRDLQDWFKKVEQDAQSVQRAVARPTPPVSSSPPNPAPSTERRSSPPPSKGRGPKREETRQELLSRLLDPVLTLEETAVILRVCPTTVRRYTNKGILPHMRSAGNQRRFRFSDVQAFLEAQDRGG